MKGLKSLIKGLQGCHKRPKGCHERLIKAKVVVWLSCIVAFRQVHISCSTDSAETWIEEGVNCATAMLKISDQSQQVDLTRKHRMCQGATQHQDGHALEDPFYTASVEVSMFCYCTTDLT